MAHTNLPFLINFFRPLIIIHRFETKQAKQTNSAAGHNTPGTAQPGSRALGRRHGPWVQGDETAIQNSNVLNVNDQVLQLFQLQFPIKSLWCRQFWQVYALYNILEFASKIILLCSE